MQGETDRSMAALIVFRAVAPETWGMQIHISLPKHSMGSLEGCHHQMSPKFLMSTQQKSVYGGGGN
jgi:hypothetical protein